MLVYNSSKIENYQVIEDKIKTLTKRFIVKIKDEYSSLDTH